MRKSILFLFILTITSCFSFAGSNTEKKEIQPKKIAQNIELKSIYLAGGCFWGVQEYMSRLDGVYESVAVYANGNTDETNYSNLHKTDHAEAVLVKYNPKEISLDTLLKYYYKIINPTSVNKQGNDVGRQYRIGIYYIDENDKKIIEKSVKELETKIGQKSTLEIQKANNIVVAEDYHQDYLKKHPDGYCHVNLELADEIIINENDYPKYNEEKLKELSSLSYKVTQEADTEAAFGNKYWNFFEDGIYVDITSGEPLFSSKDKYHSDCGWPSFVQPIVPEVVKYFEDNSYNLKRIEVRSRSANAHLGHVFEDGPVDRGGLRYCINSAAIDFIPYDQMSDRGYGYLMKLVK